MADPEIELYLCGYLIKCVFYQPYQVNCVMQSNSEQLPVPLQLHFNWNQLADEF